jgi:hypothetical protein
VLRILFSKKLLWVMAVLIALPVLWILRVEYTYERNMRRGIPADFHMYREHTVEMWKV